ncbi:DNA cytosine methyltransferase [Spongiactinospora sp. TRM90649]|uniref:DNA cytosine methyltransferase n=1 Tax=Spongiactinospora sp. TRM90649 TaxID=3031114 RepID=UPI0023F7196E|nr:DNA cytosine methyltransferase [Spongiactinospora sp. TRM90649]MDF5759123.1 DNA cytosine methyltransferase [Spongiactinospora sp. TRM90649]
MILALYAGPGGMDQGARILGIDEPIHGHDIDTDACATATAAGFHRTRADVPQLDPEHFPKVTGAVITPPCPTFSTAGKRSALHDRDRHAIALALARLGDSHAGLGAESAYAQVYRHVQDTRSALVVEALRFALRLPNVQWVIAEQVPAVAAIWQETASELAAAADFEHCAVITLAADDLGVASRRTRVFLIAARDHTPDLTGLPMREWWSCGRFGAPRLHPPLTGPFPPTTMADALHWAAGERVNTRGARRTSGGNEFPADRPAWCLTEKARSWTRVSDGARLTPAQAGLLTGFPAFYPWHGSRSKQFLQAADVIAPPVAAAVLGAVLGLDWQPAVRAYLAALYPARTPITGYLQPYLFEAVA